MPNPMPDQPDTIANPPAPCAPSSEMVATTLPQPKVELSPERDELAIAFQVRGAVTCLSEHDETSDAVLALKRVEVLVFLRAMLRRASLSTQQQLHVEPATWEAIQRLAPELNLDSRLTHKQFALLKSFLGPEAELSLVGLSAKERRQLGQALRRVAAILGKAIDAERARVSRQRLLRRARILAVALVPLVTAAFIIVRLPEKPNLALHRPVAVSSVYGEFTDGVRLVDGDRKNVGFHTQTEPGPHVTIDLGAPKSFNKIVVYNRNDCCKERAIPLRIETSDDGKKFQPVAERSELFDVWTARGLHAKARYVRLRLDSTNPFHLSEVEIY